MSFCLIKHKGEKGSFEIVHEEEVHLCNDEIFVIKRGDEATLKKAMQQLEKSPCIVLTPPLAENMLCSPLMKISRIVTVTSSGNTKFSISPTDPYSTDSDEEYVPPARDDVSSSGGSSWYSQKSTTRVRNISGMSKVKRFLNFDSTAGANNFQEEESGGTYERRSVVSKSPESSPSTSAVLESGVITITNKDVLVDVYTTLHHGTYNVSFEKFPTTQIGEDVLKGTIPVAKTNSDHKCRSVDPRRTVGYVLLSSERDTITLHLECCLERGIAEGTLMFIEQTKTWNGFLKFSCEDFLDEMDVTPVKTMDNRTLKMKQHYCMFCKQLKTCIGRHYKRLHSEEERVRDIIKAEKEENNRAKAHFLMKKLRLEGDHIYNKSVSLFDRIPIRKPAIQMIHRSVHCPSCNGLIAGRNFHKHHRTCTGRAADKRKRLRQFQGEERLNYFGDSEDDRTFHMVLNPMTADNVRGVIETDPLMKSLCLYLVKSQPRTHNLNNVRQQLRRCARLFLKVQEKIPDVKEMKDMFTPNHYTVMTESVRQICDFHKSDEKRKSQLALSYGPLISSLITRLTMDLLKSGVSKDDSRVASLEVLQRIHLEEFKVEITRQALTSSKNRKMSIKFELPKAEDIQSLLKYTRTLGDEMYEKLNTSFDVDSWINLGRALLCQLLVFNRRRVGEMSRVRVEDFKNRRDVSPEYFQSLNRLEIILANEFSVVPIMAKRNRLVNILVTKTQIKQLELLISLRGSAGVPDENVYLFASPTQTDGYLKASDVLRSFASQCGASNPSSLKSTHLRKHVATMSQVFCLNDNEMKQLADFLGHDRDVHEKFYRLNESNSQITKLSKFLCAVGDKDVFKYRGKTIEELPFCGREDIGLEGAHFEEDDDDNDDEQLEDANTSEENIHPFEMVPGTSESSSFDQSQQQPVQTPSRLEIVPGTSKASSVYQSQQQPVQTPSKYKLRRRSNLKLPMKLKSPTKLLKKLVSPAKSPRTTNELLTILAVPQRKHAKKLRWSSNEKNVMETEFAEFLENQTLPPLSFCAEVKKRNFDVLEKRDVHSIYCWLRNNLNKR